MAATENRYDGYPIFKIEDARRGTTYGRIPRRDLIVAGNYDYRMIMPKWSIDRSAYQTQGSAAAWWMIMDTNHEYMHPWDIMVGDIIRLPRLS